MFFYYTATIFELIVPSSSDEGISQVVAIIQLAANSRVLTSVVTTVTFSTLNNGSASISDKIRTYVVYENYKAYSYSYTYVQYWNTL